jgi:hypothetical protein
LSLQQKTLHYMGDSEKIHAGLKSNVVLLTDCLCGGGGGASPLWSS